MKNINFKVRCKNKVFWLTLVPMLLLLAQQVCAIFGIEIDVTVLTEQCVAVIGTVFAILAILGIVVDPTTKGVGDTTQAQQYTEPRGDVDEICMKEAE